jgi:hypothetical protein
MTQQYVDEKVIYMDPIYIFFQMFNSSLEVHDVIPNNNKHSKQVKLV